MSSLINYDNYHARIDYDGEDGIFVGHVLGINDELYFHGTTVEELKKAFTDCIYNYKEYCKEAGKTPEKEYRGSFNIRIDPDIHRQMALESAREGISINQFVSESIKKSLKEKQRDYL